MIRRRAGGLDYENVLASDVLLNLHKRLPVGERLDGGFAELDADIGTNGPG
jgi:hypothetical protein